MVLTPTPHALWISQLDACRNVIRSGTVDPIAVINVIDIKIGSIEILIARQFLLDNPSLYPPSKQLNTIRSTLPTLSDVKKRTSAASLIKAYCIPIVITALHCEYKESLALFNNATPGKTFQLYPSLKAYGVVNKTWELHMDRRKKSIVRVNPNQSLGKVAQSMVCQAFLVLMSLPSFKAATPSTITTTINTNPTETSTSPINKTYPNSTTNQTSTRRVTLTPNISKSQHEPLLTCLNFASFPTPLADIFPNETSGNPLLRSFAVNHNLDSINKLYEVTRVIKPSLNNSNYSIALERTVKKTTTYLLQCRTNSSFTVSVINSDSASNGYMLKPTELKYCKMLSPLTWRLVVSLRTPNVVAGQS